MYLSRYSMTNLEQSNKMPSILQNIVELRKNLSNVSIESFGFKGFLASINDDVKIILEQIQPLRGCYYTLDNKDVIFDNIESGKEVCIIIDLGAVPNYYNSFPDFIRSNKNKLEHSEFYIQEIDYFHGKSPANNLVENYIINISIIEFLSSISDYKKPVADSLELFFYKAEQGAAFKIEYSEESLQTDLSGLVSGISELRSDCTIPTDSKVRKQLFINELINLLNQKGNTYQTLLDNWETLIDNYKKSFSLYLSGFSFEKVRTASIEYFHELTDRIHSTILKYSTYIFAIPVAYILLIRFLDFSGENWIKDTFLLAFGILFFVLIWYVSFKSISEAIAAIEKDILSFKDKIGEDDSLQNIRLELDEQYKKVIPRQKRKLCLVKVLTILILVSLVTAYSLIHFKKLEIFKSPAVQNTSVTSPKVSDEINTSTYKDSVDISTQDSCQSDKR